MHLWTSPWLGLNFLAAIFLMLHVGFPQVQIGFKALVQNKFLMFRRIGAENGAGTSSRFSRRVPSLTYRCAFLATAVGVSLLGLYAAYAQVPSTVGKVLIESVTSRSVQLRLPALPAGASSFKLQRATRNSSLAVPPATGRLAWFKADALSGLSDGAPVAQWPDVAGGGFHASQNNPAWRPTLVNSFVAGRPAVHFDGIDDYLALPSNRWNFRGGLSAFVVAKPQSPANGARFLDFGNGPDSDNILLARAGSSSALAYVSFNGRRWSGLYPSDVLTGGLQLIEVVHQGGVPGTLTSAKIFNNGTQMGNEPTFVPLDVTRTSNYIAKSNWSDAPFQGDIAEIILYNTALSDANRQSVESYLQRKYGLGIAPSDLTWTDLASGLAGEAVYSDDAVNPTTTYWYRCIAEGGSQELTGPSAELTTLPDAPAVPEAPQSEAVAATQAVLTPPAVPTGATHLELQQKAAGAPDSSYTTVVSVFERRSVVNSLTAQTSYAFRCVAVGEGGRTIGGELMLTTSQLDPPAAPAAPTVENFTATGVNLRIPPLPARATTLSLQRAAALVPAAPPMAPDNGLQLWLRADSVSGIASGGQPSRWGDSSGHGDFATQSDPALRSRWISGGLNGRPVMHLDGIDDYWQLPPHDDIRTAFVVAKHATGSQDWAPLLGSSNTAWHGGPDNRLFWWEYTSSQVKEGQSFLNGEPISPLALTKPTSFSLISLVTAGPVRVDSLSAQIGWGGRSWSGDYAEVLLYKTVLSPADRQSAETYLMAKYDLGAAPSGLTWTTIATGKTGGESFEDDNLSPDTRYFYRCVAAGEGGTTAGKANGATTLPLAPAAPESPRFDQIGQRSVRVQAPALPARGLSLTLQKKLSSQNDSSFESYADGVNGGGFTVVSGLLGGTAYTFRYVSSNAGGTAVGETAAISTLPAPPDAPDAPSFSDVSSTSLRVHLPPLPAQTTTLTLQRAKDTRPLVSPLLPGMAVWLKADALGGLSNGEPLAVWPDASGQGYSATQIVTGSRPQLISSVLSGKPVVRFDGADDFLQLPSGLCSFNSGLSAFVVTTPRVNPFSRFFDFGNGAGNNNILFAPRGNSPLLAYLVFNGQNYSGLSSDNGITSGTPQILSVVQQGGIPQTSSSVRTFRNGSETGAGSAFVPSDVERTINYIGKSNWNDPLFQGDIAEILIYNTALTETQRQQVNTYLQRKYEIASAPPSDLNWTTVATDLSEDSVYPDSGLTSESQYFYRCLAVGPYGTTPGAVAGTQTQPPAPLAPEQPTFNPIAATYVNVAAPALPERAVSLRLEKKGAGEPDAAYTEVASGIAAQATTVARGLSAQTNYAFRFVAVGSGGVTPGLPDSVTTVQFDPPAPPAAPVVTQIGPNSIDLQMPALPERATSLSLQRAVAQEAAPTAPPTSGLQVWLKADAVRGLTSGAALSMWNDSSGKGNNATQNDVVLRPQWIKSALNGRPFVHLNGNGQILRFPTQQGIRTALVVVRHTTGSQSWAPILGSPLNQFHSGYETKLFHPEYTRPEVREGQAYWNGQSVRPLEFNKPTTFGLLSLVTSGPVSLDSLSAQAEIPERSWNGDYAEVLLYNTVLSTADRQSAENYLRAKYSLGEAPSGLNWTTLASNLVGGAATQDSDRDPNTRYFYRCVASGQGGTTPGAIASATTLPEITAADGAPDAPPAPSVLNAQVPAVELKLSALSQYATSYSLQRATQPAPMLPPSSGLNLWLKADAVRGVAEGDPVAIWPDSSRGGHNATQGEIARRPTFVASAFSGRPALRFNGNGQYFASNLIGPGGSGLTFFVVAKGSQYQSMLRFQGDGYVIYPWSYGGPQRFINSNDGGTGDGINTGFVVGEANIGTAVWKADTPNGMRTYRNGSLIAQRNTNNSVLPANSLRIGSYGDGWGEFPNADIAEILVYNQALSNDARRNVERYLAGKYAVVAAAPEDLDWQTIATNQAGLANFTDTPVSPAVTYWYRCLAVGPGGSTPGEAVPATPQEAPPASPDAPTFQNVEQTALKVIAPALPLRAQSLTLQRRLSSASDTEYVDVPIQVTPGSAVSITGLFPETAYLFRFVANGWGGNTPGAGAGITTVANLIRNGGFEVAHLSAGQYHSYERGIAPPWVCEWDAFLASNGSEFNNGTAPEGVQVAVIKRMGALKQTVTMPSGTYMLRFFTAARGGLSDDMAVKIDGQVVGQFTQTNAPNDWQEVSTPPFVVTGGDHEVCLEGLDSAGGDRTLFVDNVQLVASGDPSGVTVTAQNDSYSVVEGQSLTVTAPGVLDNDSASDGGALTAIGATNPLHGTLTLQSSGAFVYTPAAGYHGGDSFTYQAKSGDTVSAVASVAITVNAAPTPPVNSAPVAQAITVSTNEDVTATGTVTATDAEGDTLTFSVTAQPTHGSLTLAPNGAFTYTPTANFNGSDSFSFKANDGTLDSAPALISITVTAVNDLPTAQDATFTTTQNVAVGTPLVAGDVDNNTLAYVIVTGPQHGALSGTAPAFTYTPTTGYSGTDSFAFKVNDGSADSTAATVSLTVSSNNPANSAPVAQVASLNMNEDTSATGTVTATDADGDALTYGVASQPQHGAVTLTPSGGFTYTPGANYNGADSFSFKANDGEVDSSAATVSITIISVNDLPTTQDATFTTPQNVAVETPLTASDVDGDTLTYAIVTEPQHGVLSGAAPALTYTSATGYSGGDSFTFKVNDGASDSTLATVSLTVSPVTPTNSAPMAQAETFRVLEHQVLTGQLHATDPDGDPLTFSLVPGDAYESRFHTVEVRPNGSFTYTPLAARRGTFNFQVSDGTHTSDITAATVEVQNVNDPPVALDGEFSTTQNQATGFYVDADDPDYDDLVFTLLTPPQHGSITLYSGALLQGNSFTDYSLRYTPDADFTGTDTLTYKASDGALDSRTATITFTVEPAETDPSPGFDALIRAGNTGSFIGDGIYNATASGQTLSRTLSSNTTTSYEVQVQNEGPEARSLVVKGMGGGTGWTPHFFDAATGGIDITGELTSASGWSTPVLAAGAGITLRVEVPSLQLLSNEKGSGDKEIAVSVTNPESVGLDRVKMQMHYLVAYRPDAKIAFAKDPIYNYEFLGDYVYLPSGDNSSPAKQTITQFKQSGFAASYYVQAQNDGASADRFRLSGPAGNDNWSVHYFDALKGGQDITAAIVGDGWLTPELAPNQTQAVRVEVTPGLGASFETPFRAQISVDSESAMRLPVLRDVVTAITTRELLDLTIQTKSTLTDSSAGANIFNKDGQGQAVSQSTYSRKPATFIVTPRISQPTIFDRYHLHTPSVYRYKASAGDANWAVRYFSDEREVTEQITGAGWESSSLALRVDVTPLNTLGVAPDKTLLIKVFPFNEIEPMDAVQAIVHRDPAIDATIRPDYEEAYTGTGVHNTDAARQTVGYSWAEAVGGTAIFQVRIHNYGNAPDSFVLKAPVGRAGWLLRYFDAPKEGTEITTALTSLAGWTSGAVEPGETLDLRLEAKPDPNVTGAVSSSALIEVTSVLDASAIDAVKATYGMQRIAKLQYSLDQGVTWVDAPEASSGEAIPGLSGQVVGVRAVRLDPSVPWPFNPDIKPLWDHASYQHVGEAVWIQCGEASTELKPIQAACGNTVTANLKVGESYRLSLRASKTYVPLGGGAPGQVNLTAKVIRADGSPAVGVTVRFTARFAGGASSGDIDGAGPGDDSAVTDAAGNAIVTLTSGTQAGAVSLQAFLIQEGQDTASARQQEVIFGLPEVESSEPVDE